MLVVMAATTACASAAPEYGGRWKSVNRYADIPQEIPLYQAYAFYPSPMDGTLKTMLERWARDSKMTLSYQHPSDFTLHSAVAGIRTNNLQEAVSQLTTAFAQQGVSITTESNQIVVRGSTPAAAEIGGHQRASRPCRAYHPGDTDQGHSTDQRVHRRGRHGKQRRQLRRDRLILIRHSSAFGIDRFFVQPGKRAAVFLHNGGR
jgi:hypothetical protein